MASRLKENETKKRITREISKTIELVRTLFIAHTSFFPLQLILFYFDFLTRNYFHYILLKVFIYIFVWYCVRLIRVSVCLCWCRCNSMRVCVYAVHVYRPVLLPVQHFYTCTFSPKSKSSKREKKSEYWCFSVGYNRILRGIFVFTFYWEM